jgi:hypothetical protein
MLSSRSGGTKGSVNKAGEWGVVGFDVGILDDRKPALVRASSKRNLGLRLCAYWWRGWASLRRERSCWEGVGEVWVLRRYAAWAMIEALLEEVCVLRRLGVRR